MFDKKKGQTRNRANKNKREQIERNPSKSVGRTSRVDFREKFLPRLLFCIYLLEFNFYPFASLIRYETHSVFKVERTESNVYKSF